MLARNGQLSQFCCLDLPVSTIHSDMSSLTCLVWVQLLLSVAEREANCHHAFNAKARFRCSCILQTVVC